MMRRKIKMAIGHWLSWLLALCLLIGLTAGPAGAAGETLAPGDLVYEDGNIILHKSAERIGADEWKVTVRATIGEMPVEKRKMEVVFVLDASGSMAWCTDEAAHAAGSHTHSNSCYRDKTCTLEDHTHALPDCYGPECTFQSNSDHWRGIPGIFEYHSSNACEAVGGSYYPLTCTKHVHTDACYVPGSELSCGRDQCTHSSSGATPCTYVNENGQTVPYKTRLQAAKDTIASMVSNLTKEGDDNVIFKYVIFSSASSSYDNGVNKGRWESTKVVSGFDNVTAEGGTDMYTGIQTGLNQFSNNDYKKVLVVLTDGAADDEPSVSANALASFKDPNGTDGTVFTVGFAYSNSTLAGIAGNGGSYVHAGSDVELNQAMQGIETSLTAMLEDPMGTSVGFDKTSIQEVQTSGGVISSTDNTIYWHPAEDGSDTVRNSTIEYSYTVQLNKQANLSAGTHDNIPLNNPTNFLYGIKDSSGVTNMNSAAFPIPEASYSVSTMQTKWQADGEDIQPPTEVEHLVNDYASANYIPAFEQDYKTITPVIPISGSNDYYRYIGTTVTANGTELDSVDDVDAARPVEYVVIHQYERVESDEMVVGGTKTLVGRDFLPGDSFTFTMTADTAGAPVPENSTVTISPSSGTSMAFSFGTLSFNQEGVYTYTIRETAGSLDGVVYDTSEHTLVVTATLVGSEIVLSYTMDGVENGHLVIANRLETGSLKVEKTTVTSHLPQHQQQPFGFLISVKDSSNRPLSGSYPLQLSDGTTQTVTFTNGYAAVSLCAGQSAVVSGLPDGSTYTVTEDSAGGFTVASTGSTGVIAAHEQREAAFTNEYHSTGLYQFIGTKRLEDADLELDQFIFSVRDEAGNVVAQGKNNPDGSIFLNTLYFDETDIGTKTYTIVEDRGSVPGVIYDRTEYVVTLTITDRGDGTLEVTDDLNGTPIVFTNRYLANQLTVSKTVAGNIANGNREFSFTITMPGMVGQNAYISTDGGATFQTLTLNAQGQADFTLKHGQSVIFYPVSGQYTVTENDPDAYVTTWSVDLGAPVTGVTATGSVGADGGHVDFVNTLETTTPTGVYISSGSAVAGICLAACLLMIITAGRRWSVLE